MSDILMLLLGGLLGLAGIVIWHLVAARTPAWRMKKWQAKKDAEWAEADREHWRQFADAELRRLYGKGLQ